MRIVVTTMTRRRRKMGIEPNFPARGTQGGNERKWRTGSGASVNSGMEIVSDVL